MFIEYLQPSCFSQVLPNLVFVYVHQTYIHSLRQKSITVTTSISDLNQWANEQGTTLAFLKMLNPWLRDNNLINRNGKEYIIQIPTEDGLYYDTESIKAYNPAWVVE